MSISQPASRVGKIREDAYFNELDQVLLAELQKLMELSGEATKYADDTPCDVETISSETREAAYS